MPRAVDIESARVDRLARELAPTIRARGSVVRAIDELENVERWRAAARRAGRSIGWRIRTGITNAGTHVYAVSDDYPVPPEDERRASDAIARALRGD
jgi:hypothetical protein